MKPSDTTCPEHNKTTVRIPKHLLRQVSRFVGERMGLNFPEERFCDLERGICSAAISFDSDSAESFIRRILSGSLKKNVIETLASHLTVGETYFFREKKTFEILERNILPELINLRVRGERSLRIWSAACATGEEPYSIAILLSRMIPDIKNWNVTILATDINPWFLQKASGGAYGIWSFRDAPPWLIDRYFIEKKEKLFSIAPHIQKMVKFFHLNLADDTYPSLLNDTNAMDIIFCRNVLMYFTPDSVRSVIYRLYCCLLNGAWLITSPCEASNRHFSRFKAINFQDAILYRKDDRMALAEEKLFPTRVIPHPNVPVIPFAVPTAMKSVACPEPPLKEPEPSGLITDGYAEAQLLYSQGRYKEASEKLISLYSSNPEDSRTVILLVRLNANMGNLSAALEWCDKGIEKNRLNPVFYYLQATILQEKNQVDQAMSSLKRTLYIDPNFVLAHFVIGILNRQQGRLKQAIKHFANAISLLNVMDKNKVIPESEGITAGRLRKIIESVS